MAKTKKYYVVWKGITPGVYDNWNECKAQVDGQDGAKYKSFETEEEAAKAFEKGYEHYLKTDQYLHYPYPEMGNFGMGRDSGGFRTEINWVNPMDSG